MAPPSNYYGAGGGGGRTGERGGGSRYRSRSFSRSRSRGRVRRSRDSPRSRARSRTERERSRVDTRNAYRSTPPTLMDCAPLSFRNFVVTREEMIKPEDALVEYENYKKEYHKYNCDKFIREHKDSGFIRERYHPTSYARQFEQQTARSRLNAKLFAEEFKRTNGFEGIRLVAPDSGPRQRAKDGEKSRTDIKLGKKGKPVPPYYLDHPAANSLVLESIPTHISKWAIADAMQAQEGFAGILMSDPRVHSSMNRTAWVLFDSVDSRDNAEQRFAKAQPIIVDDFPLLFEHASLPDSCKANVTPRCACRDDVIQSHLQLSRQLIELLDKKWEVHQTDEGEADKVSWMDELEGKQNHERLDMQLTYLRRVHNLCFYSGKKCVDEMQLWSLCGSLCVRPVATKEEVDASGQAESDVQWLRELENNTIQLLQESHRQKMDEQNEFISVKWKAYCEEHTLKVDEDRYRCDICRKLFKGTDFVAKHLRSKHKPAYDSVTDVVALSAIPQNYLEDKHRLVVYPTKQADILTGRKEREIFLDYPYGRGPDGGMSHAAAIRQMEMQRNGRLEIGPPVGMPGHHFLPPYGMSMMTPEEPKPYGAFTDWDRPSAGTGNDAAAGADPSSVCGRPVVYYDDL